MRSSDPRLRWTAWSGAALLGAALGCTLEVDATVLGSGLSVSEPRTVPEFGSIVVGDDLDVVVKYGSSPLILLHGDDNLLPMVVTDVRGDRLVVEVREGYQLDPPPRIEIHSPRLTSIAYQGAGTARVLGLEGEGVELVLTGSGSLEAAGRMRAVRVRAVGSGAVDLSQLEVDEADVDSIGSGDVAVRALRLVTVRSVGSGEVEVAGGARIDEKAIGSGRVVVRDR